MADITLGDYAGYIFLEMIKAREMSDAYSRMVAERYANDEVLKFFSVPRFKIPHMELTIPVLVAGARFTQVIRFRLELEEFMDFVVGRIEDLLRRIELEAGRPPPARQRRKYEPSDTVRGLAREFHEELRRNADPLRPDNIVGVAWPRIVEHALDDAGVRDAVDKADPKGELRRSTTVGVIDVVKANTVIDRTSIESLLINPETNVVKDGSSDATVFTIKAEMVEEGFYLRSVKDESSGEVRPIVEFE
jgi:hypothetical protein